MPILRVRTLFIDFWPGCVVAGNRHVKCTLSDRCFLGFDCFEPTGFHTWRSGPGGDKSFALRGGVVARVLVLGPESSLFLSSCSLAWRGRFSFRSLVSGLLRGLFGVFLPFPPLVGFFPVLFCFNWFPGVHGISFPLRAFFRWRFEISLGKFRVV